MKFINCETVNTDSKLSEQIQDHPNYQKELWFRYQDDEVSKISSPQNK